MYKAQVRGTQEVVAVKVIPLGDKDEVLEIQKEIEMLKECNHANVVRYLVIYCRSLCIRWCFPEVSPQNFQLQLASRSNGLKCFKFALLLAFCSCYWHLMSASAAVVTFNQQAALFYKCATGRAAGVVVKPCGS